MRRIVEHCLLAPRESPTFRTCPTSCSRCANSCGDLVGAETRLRWRGVCVAEGGIRFGQYILLRRIARGGMARCSSPAEGLEGSTAASRSSASCALADAPDFLRMFLTEARLAAQLTHPNVVHIYDFGKHDGDYFHRDGVRRRRPHRPAVQAHREGADPATMVAGSARRRTRLHYAHELRNANGSARLVTATSRREHHGVVRRS